MRTTPVNKETQMTFTITINKPTIKSPRTLVNEHRYNKMIKASQKKLAETTPVSYTQIWA